MGKWIMMHKKQIKLTIDVAMTLGLLFLMALQVTGDKYHEWIGAGMLLLFVMHNGLNWNWYRNFFRGKYAAQRIARTSINVTVLIAIIVTGYSGIVLSRYVFAFLPIESGMATARKLHLAGSYWTFVLMSIHLGMHWSMVTSRMKAHSQKKAVLWFFRITAFSVAIYGAYLFGRTEIFKNMFLQNAFALLEYETPGVLILIQNLAMMSTWIFIGYYFLLFISFLNKHLNTVRIRG